MGYFLMPFLTISWLTKIFSPTCSVINAFQGDEYLPPWCEEVLIPPQPAQNENENINVNTNAANNNTNENANTNSANGNLGIANPAAVKCLEDGGKLENYTNGNGEFAICVFSDQSICEEWAYFRKECEVGKCFKQCDQVGTQNEGWYNTCTKELLKLEVCSKTTEQNQTANITVKNPAPNQQLSSPFKVEGQARVFENQINIRVKSKDGRTLITESAIVNSPEVGQWGDFSIEISYDFNLTKEGFIEVYSTSAKDGSEENLVSIPVKF